MMSFMDRILNEERAVTAHVLRETTAVAPQISPKSRAGGAGFAWQQGAAQASEVFVVKKKKSMWLHVYII